MQALVYEGRESIRFSHRGSRRSRAPSGPAARSLLDCQHD